MYRIRIAKDRFGIPVSPASVKLLTGFLRYFIPFAVAPQTAGRRSVFVEGRARGGGFESRPGGRLRCGVHRVSWHIIC
jgi:hypothetical protein